MSMEQEPTPAQKAQVQANVAKMRSKGASEDDVAKYLAYESGQLSQTAAPSLPTAPAQPGAPPGAPPESLAKGFGRSLLQHSLFNFGDELGLVDQKKQDQFASGHKILNFIATLGGGILGPAAAAVAAPEAAATAGGAMAIGGLSGMLSGAGDQSGAGRADNALQGAAGGVLGGVAGNLAGKAAATAGPAMMKGAAHELTSPEALAHGMFLGPKGYAAKVVGSGMKGGAKAITRAIKDAVVNKAPAEKAANLFELTQQFGGGSTNLFAAPAAAAAKPSTGVIGGMLGGQAGAAAPSMFHEPDQQY